MTTYRGRFAPSPTGPLHFGSLVAAVGSYLEARSRNGIWLVRMEDIDPPREIVGAADDILKTLEQFGFEWDEQVMFQSSRLDAYEQAFQTLKEKEFIYACSCSRKEIAATGKPGLEGNIYTGLCRDKEIEFNNDLAIRVKTRNNKISFTDTLQGNKTCNLRKDIGDFIVRRKDGLFAYQLAVVVDDAEQNISHVVRGNDLLNSSFRQIYLQELLELPRVDYCHLPVAINAKGDKLSKQTSAPALDKTHPVDELVRAMKFLNHKPPKKIQQANLAEFWNWAIKNWKLNKVPNHYSLSV